VKGRRRKFFNAEAIAQRTIAQGTIAQGIRGTNMLNATRRLCRLAAAVAGVFLSAHVLRAEELNFPAVLPAGAVAYVQATDVSSAINLVTGSAYVNRVLSSPLIQEAYDTAEYRRAMAVREIVERQFGLDSLVIAKALIGRRVGLAAYPPVGGKQPDTILIAEIGDVQAWRQIQSRLKPLYILAEDELDLFPASNDGTKNAANDREPTRLVFRKAGSIAYTDRWIVAANRKELTDQTVARLLKTSDATSSLSTDAPFQQMLADVQPKQMLWGYVNSTLLKSPDGARLIPQQLDNPLGSLLFGGLTELAARSPYIAASIDLGSHGLAASICTAAVPADLPPAWQALVATIDSVDAPRLPAIPGLIGGWVLARDFATWYRSREVLLPQRLLPDFDQFETGIANLLPGKDFGEDVIPLLGRSMTLVAAPQDYADLDGSPGIKLPAFALIVELEKPREGSDLMQMFFQTATLILNIEAANQRRQPWVMNSETYKDVQINFARYLKRPKGDSLPIVYNFTPAGALVGHRYVLCSSKGLLRQLIDAYSSPETATSESAASEKHADRVQLNGPALVDALSINRESLEANGIREGKSKSRAAAEIDGLFDLLRRIDGFDLRTISGSKTYRVQAELRWK
jgi:hypothetical protein